MKKIRHSTYLLLIVAIMGIAMRLSGLDLSPPGLYVDEASIAENAYQIMTTGKDEWGVPYPIYFKAFGEYKNPLFIYSVVPLFQLLTPSIFSLRAAAALWGLATIAVFTLLIGSLTRQKQVVIISAILLIFLPWHWHLSRIAFEAVSFPFFFTLLLLSVLSWQKKPHFIWLWLSALSSGCMFYSYTSARFLSPVSFLVILFLTRQSRFRHKLLAIITYTCLLMPAASWNIIYPGSLLARYEQIKSPGFIEMANTYLKEFSPEMWFVSGDSNLHHTPNKSLIPLSLIPLFFLGLGVTIKAWRQPLNAFVLFSLFVGPIPASLTTTDPNALRIVHLIPILVLLISKGYLFIIHHPKKTLRKVALIFLVVWVYETSQFVSTYFRDMPTKLTWWFDTPYVASLPHLTKYQGEVWVHHYLLHQSHEVTARFICHTLPNCTLGQFYFSESAETYYPGKTNIYFGHDCEILTASPSAQRATTHSSYCMYR